LFLVLGDLPTFGKDKDNFTYSSIGASGAVSGILFMFILFNPWRILELYFIIPIPAIILGILYLWYSSWASKNQQDMIDHEAHLYGALSGIMLMLFLIPSSLPRFMERIVTDFPL